MMWKSMIPDSRSGRVWEPVELRVLKRQLANFTCDCNLCKTGHGMLYSEQKDQEIQAEIHLVGSPNQFTQAATGSNLTVGSTVHRSEAMCPSCLVTMNLFKGGGMVRVLKDEEIETKPEMFSCDKSVGKVLNCLEKTTSMTKCSVQSDYLHSPGNAFISELSSDVSLHEKKDRVRFCDECINIDKDLDDEKRSIRGTCMCLGTLIDSLRPPEPLGHIIRQRHWG